SLRRAGSEAAEGFGQGGAFEDLPAQRRHQRSGLGQVLSRGFFRKLDVFPVLRGARCALFGRFEVSMNADESLGQGVVDLAGQPASLLEDSGPALLFGEFGSGRL
ncbi:MAG: hypothetical protein L0G70_11690, partial [Rubrobacter sp.]|nr:hypothetical protein [Rubrobacter sp.]